MIFLWLLSFFLAINANAVSTPHADVELLLNPQQLTDDLQETYVGIRFRLQKGWHLYWQNPGDVGFAPQIKWQIPDGVHLEPLPWPVPQRILLGPSAAYGYEDEVTFLSKVERLPKEDSEGWWLKARLHWLLCADTCVPAQASLEVFWPKHNRIDTESQKLHTLPKAPQLSQKELWLEKAQSKLPLPGDPNLQITLLQDKDHWIFKMQPFQETKLLDFYSLSPSAVHIVFPAQIFEEDTIQYLVLKKHTSLQQKDAKTMPPSGLDGLLLLQQKNGDKQTYQIFVVAEAADENSNTLYEALQHQQQNKEATQPDRPSWFSLKLFFLFFLGGALLNLMPCVLPVFSLKILHLTQHSQSSVQTIRHYAWFYTLGIVLSCWSLAAMTWLAQQAGTLLGWGFQMQNPQVILLLAELYFLLALSLAGVFEMQAVALPQKIMSFSNNPQKTASNSRLKAFVNGLLITVVSTPCTGPLLSSALAISLTQPQPIMLLSNMTAMALGLASPFVLISHYPKMFGFFPKAGSWMVLFKQGLAIPLFATSLWLLTVLMQQTSLDNSQKALWLLLPLVLVAWLWRLAEDPWIQSLSQFAQRSCQLSGWFLLLWVVQQSLSMPNQQADSCLQDTTTTEESLFLNDHISHWQPYSEEALLAAQQTGHAVFVDFTAAWCLTCQINERFVLQQPRIQKRFKQTNIVLLKADWTQNQPHITKALQKLGRIGVPVYALYHSDIQQPPILLPEILTIDSLLQAIATVAPEATGQ